MAGNEKNKVREERVARRAQAVVEAEISLAAQASEQVREQAEASDVIEQVEEVSVEEPSVQSLTQPKTLGQLHDPRKNVMSSSDLASIIGVEQQPVAYGESEEPETLRDVLPRRKLHPSEITPSYEVADGEQRSIFGESAPSDFDDLGDVEEFDTSHWVRAGQDDRSDDDRLADEAGVPRSGAQDVADNETNLSGVDEQLHMREVHEQSLDPIDVAKKERRAAEKKYAKPPKSDNPYLARDAKDAAARKRKINAAHDNFAQEMAQAAMGPLRKGVNTQTVMAACTTAAVMWCMSPRMTGVNVDMKRKINKDLEQAKDTKLSKYVSKDFWKSKLTRDKTEKEAKSLSDAFMQQKTAIISNRERIPMSVASAAQTVVRLSDQAYEAMREVDTDGQPVVDAHDVSAQVAEDIDMVVKQGEEHGLKSKDIYGAARDIVGRRMERDPGYAARFNETAFGTVRLGEQRRGMVISKTPTWQFPDGAGLSKNAGWFSVREPMGNAQNFADNLAATLATEMRVAGEQYGSDGVRDVVAGFMTATDVSESGLASAKKLLPDFDTRGRSASRVRQIAMAQRTQAAIKVLQDDGNQTAMTTEQVKEVQVWAMDQAEKVMQRDHPAILDKFVRKHGQTFGQDADAFVKSITIEKDTSSEYTDAMVRPQENRGSGRELAARRRVQAAQINQAAQLDMNVHDFRESNLPEERLANPYEACVRETEAKTNDPQYGY